jgi:hypothetical protein
MVNRHWQQTQQRAADVLQRASVNRCQQWRKMQVFRKSNPILLNRDSSGRTGRRYENNHTSKEFFNNHRRALGVHCSRHLDRESKKSVALSRSALSSGDATALYSFWTALASRSPQRPEQSLSMTSVNTLESSCASAAVEG